MTTYREGSDPEGWDFDTSTVAGKQFLDLKAAAVLVGTDFYGLNNEEVAMYFIKEGVMTNRQFYEVFGRVPDMTA